jgi:hypothetical protein
MQGAATQAMPLRIVEERQRSRCPPQPRPVGLQVQRPAGFVAPAGSINRGMVMGTRVA